jgi:hypothetical protein
MHQGRRRIIRLSSFTTHMRRIMPRNSSRATSLSAMESIQVAATTKPYRAIGTCTKIGAARKMVKNDAILSTYSKQVFRLGYKHLSRDLLRRMLP